MLGEKVIPKAMASINDLRTLDNLSISIETNRRSLKAQMREANRKNATFVIIIGENDFYKNLFLIKNMINSEQTEVALKDLKQFFIDNN